MEQLCGEIQVTYSKIHQPASSKLRNEVPEREDMVSNRTATLPKIELPKFDGNLINWCAFRDMFTSLVHENRLITDSERFHYLISCVSGSALNIVRSIPLTSHNYAIAWNALEERYNNKRLLATAHLEKIFSFERLPRESVLTLSSFVNTFRENVAAIKALGVDDLSGFLLYFIAARVIDPETRRLFEASMPQDSVPTLEELLHFVAHRCKILENIGINKTSNSSTTVINSDAKKIKGGRTSAKTSLSVTVTDNNSCVCCDHDHPLFRCFKFKKKSVAERRQLVVDKGLCFLCLRSDHMANACTTTFSCNSCRGRHHNLLHVDPRVRTPRKASSTTTTTPKSSEVVSETTTTSSSFSGTINSDIRVVLSTAIVRIRNQAGDFVPVRVLLDSGSQISAITNQCANQLGLTRQKGRIEVFGLAQQPIRTIKGTTSCCFIPRLSDTPQISASQVVILPKITTVMPNQKLPDSVREKYGHLPLADPDFDVPGYIDMLIGGDLYPFILQSRSDIIHSPGLPSALHTQFGWIIVGALEGLTQTSALSALTVKATSDEHDFCEIMQQFWAVEEPETSRVLSTEDRQIESWFQNTTSREVDGRFSVALPLKKIISAYTGNSDMQYDIEYKASSFGLGSSRAMALNRLYNLERRLSKDEELYNAYRDFMEEYIALGHMKLAESIGEYFIPHHAVVKRKDNEFKVRVVFDASAPSSSGRSLNDCLVTGPKLQTDIGDILLRSRFYKYIFVADIVKMYRQITVQKEYRVFQHILWRRSPSEEVQEYELCTVTYGLNSAPFLAIRCLLQLEQENGPAFPLARPFIRENTYVDDIIAGANSIEEALEVQRQVIGLLKSGCFELKKWASNCDAILKGVPVQDLASGSCYEPTIGQAVKILGLYWEPYEDKFGYRSTIEDMPLTKRSILSVLARFYDPIGALGPMIFWAKCLMQELWCQYLEWDAIVPENISSKWKTFLSELSSLVQLTLPRQIAIDRVANVQLVGFSDASQKGYAASVFLRVEDDQGLVKVYFIACKSKVAPLKAAKTDMSLTIPRLELCAALLLARLLAHEFSLLKELVSIQRVRAFSDSTIVLAWLKAEPKEFKVFVSNRIIKIKELLPQCEWNHVKSAENAANPQPVMADLPQTRVQPHRPFAFVGMDYGGPFSVKESRRRGAKVNKAYLALFICFSVKAVHLEVVSDLSTEAFLAAFDRFTARRGISEEIRSDCGSPFEDFV